MTQNQTNYYGKLVNQGKGKQALDEMLAAGFSSNEIGEFYRSINFYPNHETTRYISDYFAARKNKEALDGFFGTN